MILDSSNKHRQQIMKCHKKVKIPKYIKIYNYNNTTYTQTQAKLKL